jgi:hypothetical protein
MKRKLVEFTRDMRPYRAGDRYALPDILADKITQEGSGKIVPSVFDKAAAPQTRDLAPQAPVKRYLTRKAK